MFEWKLAIVDDKGATIYETQLSSAPAKNIRYTTYGGYVPSDILPYTKMAESAFGEFGRKLAGDFGIAIAKPADADFGNEPTGALPPGLSPEVRKALDDLAKSGRMSDATRKMLLDMQKRQRARTQ